MSKKKFSGSISGKGYYIALILCAVAIGISGYFYYRNANNTESEAANPTSAAEVVEDGDVQVVATQPGREETPAPTLPQQPDAAQPQKPGKTVSPVSGSTIGEYAVDTLAYNQTTRDWRVHDGVDIAAEAGTAVSAAADGTVYSVYEDETMGMTVVISHADGYATCYSSLSQEVCVSPGDTVAAGDTIGYAGNTALLETAMGDHVHFSVSCSGESVDPADFLSEDPV